MPTNNFKKTDSTVNNSNAFNIVKFMDHIRINGSSTMTEISESTGIALSTTYRVSRFLSKHKILKKVEKMDSEMGRKAWSYSVNSGKRHLLGISLNREQTTIFISNLGGKVVAKNVIETPEIDNLKDILEIIDQTIKKTMLSFFRTDIVDAKIDLIGFVVSADIDSKCEKIIRFNGAPFLDGFSPVEYMTKKYGVQTLLVQQTTVESYASVKQMREQGIENYIYLHIGMGIAASIMVNGSAYLGFSGKAGEIADIILPNGSTLEESISTKKLYMQVYSIIDEMDDHETQQILRNLISEHISGEARPITYALEKILSNKKSEKIEEVIDSFAQSWARLIYYMAIFYDPAAIAIGGGIDATTPLILNLIKMHLEKLDNSLVLIPIHCDDMYSIPAAVYFLDTLYSEMLTEVIGEQKNL